MRFPEPTVTVSASTFLVCTVYVIHVIKIKYSPHDSNNDMISLFSYTLIPFCRIHE